MHASRMMNLRHVSIDSVNCMLQMLSVAHYACVWLLHLMLTCAIDWLACTYDVVAWLELLVLAFAQFRVCDWHLHCAV